MTARQLEILQHALGVDQYGQGRMYRNHFCAGGGNVQTCQELISLGYMRRVATTTVFPDFNCRVTDEGRVAVLRESPKPPKLTRSQERYRRFLKADTGCSFIEWLRNCDRRVAE
jgi:hypothetical protein